MKKGILAILTAFVFCFSLGSVQTAHASWLGDLLGAIGDSGNSTARNQDIHTISGKVVNHKDEMPLQNADIQVIAYDKTWSRKTTTDANGNYSINVPKGKDYTVIASKIGYQTNKYNELQYTDIVNIMLWENTVTGKVTDENGLPMHWVKLTFELNGGQNGVQTVYTDENGNYTYTLPENNEIYWYTIHQDGYKDLRGQTTLRDEEVWNITMHLL